MPSRLKVCYVVSGISKIIAFEWIARHINHSKFELSFVIMDDRETEIEAFLKEKNIAVKKIRYSGKKDMPRAIFLLYIFFMRTRPDAVHTHLFDATLAGLTAAKVAGIKKRIHTRHHSTYHYEYFKKALKYDYYINFVSTHIIAISEVVKKVLVEKDKVPASKVVTINHGFDIDEFANVSTERISAFRRKYNINGTDIVIGVVSRFTFWKGIQYIIPAFKRLAEEMNNIRFIFANTVGDYHRQLEEQLMDLRSSSVIKIIYERDMGAMYKCMNVYVHAPIDSHSEAFGQTYVEALLAEIPSVFTLSGIACEFIEHEKNAIVVNYADSNEIYVAVKRLLNDKALASYLVINGKESVRHRFSLEQMINKLETLYMQ